MNLEDLNPKDKHMLCFVGQGGHGKSIAASYFGKKPYYASCDGRMASVRNWWLKRDPARIKDIHFDQFRANEFDKLAVKLESLQQNCPYDCVILDPLTMIAHMLIQYGMAGRGPSAEDMKKHPKVRTAQIDDYKVESHGIKQVIDAGRYLQESGKAHFILCAHILEETHYTIGEDKPRIRRSLMTAGKQPAAMIPGMFDEVWLFTIASDPIIGKPPRYKLITAPNEEFSTLRTSCGMPTELDWTDKDVFKIAEPYLNKFTRGKEVAPNPSPNEPTIQPTTT